MSELAEEGYNVSKVPRIVSKVPRPTRFQASKSRSVAKLVHKITKMEW
jgi:hypothetical protein